MYWCGEKYENDPVVNRFLTEGVCPNCKIPLLRTHQYTCACIKCDFKWVSKRIEVIFPKEMKEA